MKLDNIVAIRQGKTIYRDGDLKIKVFDETYSKADVLNEALNQARVEDIDVNIPKVIEVKKIEGKWAIVSEFIEGKTLTELMREFPEKKQEYLDLFVDVQMNIHKQRCPLLNKLRDKMNRKIEESALDATARYELHARLAGMPKRNKVCHGDFNPSNVIITEQGVPYVIDWSHVTQGNAAADAARTYLVFCLAGQEKLANEYLTLFCKKSDTARQYVNKWLPIVAASQSVKGKPEEREILLRWANVMDFEQY